MLFALASGTFAAFLAWTGYRNRCKSTLLLCCIC